MIQIVPYFTPQVTGVGDYALVLAREFRRAHGLDTRFIVVNPSWSGPRTVEGFAVKHVSSRSAVDLARILETEAVFGPMLFHYSGYGFHPRGFPFWLARGLRHARVSGPILTMFHELFAFGPPWSSAFWTSCFQRSVAAKVARLSGFCFTNRKKSAEWIEAAAPSHKSHVSVFPVFSNFGEPASVSTISERAARGLVWGTIGRSIRSSEQAANRIKASCRHLGIEQLVVIGDSIPDLEGSSLRVEVVKNLSAAQISDMLLQSRTGFLDYFDGYLGKSSIFAAFASHGVVPILLHQNDSEADGLSLGQHFLAATGIDAPVSLNEQQQISVAAKSWYDPHNVRRTAAAMAVRFASAVVRQVPTTVQTVEVT